MIKAVLRDCENRTVVFLGLSETNVALLHDDKPIYFDMKGLGDVSELEVKLKDARVVIIVGKTENSILRSLEVLMGPGTPIIDQTKPVK